MKEKFPKASDWEREDEWYNQMLQNLKSAKDRSNIQDSVSTTKIIPIYRRHSSQLLRQQTEGNDLEGIIMSLLKSVQEDKYQRRLWLVFTYLADARGGEAKFLNYGDWIWDDHLQIFEVIWRELKTVEEYAVVFGPDFDNFACDIYHALACFWCIERGLHRPLTLHQKLSGYDKLVFPKIRAYNESWLSQKISSLLKKFLPDCVAKLVSSKSLRKGATTEMVINPFLDHKFALLQSGHLSKHNDRFYTASVTAGSLPGFKVLAG